MTNAPLEQVVRLLETSCDAPPAAVDAIQHHGLMSLLTGTPVTLADISDESGVCIDEIRAGVAGLQAAGRIEVEGSRVIGVGGLTISPTIHTLALPLATIHTWCGLDAVGIPAALALDADVSTSCPHCANPIQIKLTQGAPEPDEAIRLFCPTAPCSDVRTDFCAAANLFCNRDHLNHWANSNPTEGTELDLHETAELGRAMWGRHRPPSTESQSR